MLTAQKETIKSNRVDTSLYIERGESEEVDFVGLSLKLQTLSKVKRHGAVLLHIGVLLPPSCRVEL